jgi:hypothetical protein
LLQSINLHLSFGKKVFEKFFVIGIKIVTHYDIRIH